MIFTTQTLQRNYRSISRRSARAPSPRARHRAVMTVDGVFFLARNEERRQVSASGCTPSDPTPCVCVCVLARGRARRSPNQKSMGYEQDQAEELGPHRLPSRNHQTIRRRSPLRTRLTRNFNGQKRICEQFERDNDGEELESTEGLFFFFFFFNVASRTRRSGRGSERSHVHAFCLCSCADVWITR